MYFLSVENVAPLLSASKCYNMTKQQIKDSTHTQNNFGQQDNKHKLVCAGHDFCQKRIAANR
jgi:hypothetical protein